MRAAIDPPPICRASGLFHDYYCFGLILSFYLIGLLAMVILNVFLHFGRASAQTEERHFRYLVLRNCRGGATFYGMLAATAAALTVPFSFARKFLSLLLVAGANRMALDMVHPEIGQAGACGSSSVAVVGHPTVQVNIAYPPLIDDLRKAVRNQNPAADAAAAKVAVEKTMRLAMVRQFAAAATAQEGLSSDDLQASAAAAAAVVCGGVWATALPFSAFVRQRPWFVLWCIVVAAAMIVRTGLSLSVAMDGCLVQASPSSVTLEYPVFSDCFLQFVVQKLACTIKNR